MDIIIQLHVWHHAKNGITQHRTVLDATNKKEMVEIFAAPVRFQLTNVDEASSHKLNMLIYCDVLVQPLTAMHMMMRLVHTIARLQQVSL